MYFMYVDESGDVGMVNSPSRYFVLSGIVLHELRWHQYLSQIQEYRQRMRTAFGLKLREEIHAAAMINRPGDLVRIKRNDRLTIIRAFADELTSMSDLHVINIAIDKQDKGTEYDVFTQAWRAMLQRFANTMTRNNFPGPHNADERGIIFADQTDTLKLTRLLRQMRRYNPVPNQSEYGPGYRHLQVHNIAEDPNFRNSRDSYFIQAADVVAFLLYQYLTPSAYMRRKSGQNYFTRMDLILSKVASTHDPYGIVRL